MTLSIKYFDQVQFKLTVKKIDGLLITIEKSIPEYINDYDK